MSRDKGLISKNKKPIHIKFYSYKPRNRSGVATLSSGLRTLIENRGFEYVDYGFNFKTKTIFLKFNNTGDGVSLLNNQDKCKNTVSATRIINVLIEECPNIDFSIPFQPYEIESHIFSLNKKVTIDAYKKEEMNSIKWLDAEEKTQVDKFQEELWVRFYKVGLRRAVMSISKGLKYFAQQTNMTHIQFGFTRENHSIFIKLNNTGDGVSLVNSMGEYKNKGLGTEVVTTRLIVIGVDLQLKTTYYLLLKEGFTFQLTSSKKTVADNKNIEWLPDKNDSINLNQRRYIKQFDESIERSHKRSEEMWVKFYKSKERQGTLRLSLSLLKLAHRNKMTHIQFGYNKKAKSVYFQLNNTGEGFSLLTRQKEYKQTGIYVSSALFYFSAADIDIKYKNLYYITKKEDLIFKIDNIGNDDTTIKKIHWITNEDTKYKSRDTVISDPQNEYSYLDESSLIRNKMIQMLTYRDFDSEYEELEGDEFLGRDPEGITLEEIKETKNNFSSFVKLSTNNPFPCSLTLSRKLLRICKKRRFTHLQITKSKDNETKEVLLELNQNGKGVSLVNSDLTYKNDINITEMFNSINKEEEILQLNAWYSGEKVTDSQFRIKVQLYL